MANKFKLFIAMKIPDELVDYLRSHSLEVRVPKVVPVPRNELLESVADVDAIFCVPDSIIDKEFLNIAKNLKVIGTLSVGYNHIDLQECHLRNIKIGYTPGVLDDAVAEFAITLTLSTLKRISESIEAARNGQWKLGDLLWMCGGSIFESTVGIFGLGRIGFQIGERIKAFKPSRLLYHDLVKNPFVDSTYEFVDLDTLLGESDIVICMCAVTPGTTGMFNMKLFQKMKPTGVFINCSRGVVVNQDDLCLALKTKTIAAAGLDVTVPEPLPPTHELYKLQSCFITPHIASGDVKLRHKMFQITAHNIINGLNGQPLVSEIKYTP